ncbi:MAG: 16S rRNA (uracil(1498)-N(3))-methyltransferase [Rhodothalassiaceae bacterium]
MSSLARSPRLYVADALPGPVALTTAQAQYLAQVLRLKPGGVVRLFNGRDGEWQARLERLDRRAATAVPTDQLRTQAPEPGPHLLFAPLKKARLDMLVEKAVELGATRLSPVRTRHTVADKIRPERLTAQIIEAAEQCERLTLPVLDPLITLDRLLDHWPGQTVLYAALERQDAQPVPAEPDAALLVGPEGGFDAGERDRLLAHAAVRPVSLGPRILRAETAVIAGLARLTRA